MRNGKSMIQVPGGVTLVKIVCTCACWTSKIWLSLYKFFVQVPTHQYTIFDRIRKAPNLPKLGAFYNKLLKIHLIYVIWATSFLMKPTDRYTKLWKSMYTMSMWEHPSCFRSQILSNTGTFFWCSSIVPIMVYLHGLKQVDFILKLTLQECGCDPVFVQFMLSRFWVLTQTFSKNQYFLWTQHKSMKRNASFSF